jgi:outer membrane lipoprotein-sorting protein
MASKSQAVFAAALLSGLIAAVPAAVGQSVPLPPPKPKSTGAVPPTAGTPPRTTAAPAPAPAQAQQQQSGPAWLPPFLFGAPQQQQPQPQQQQPAVAARPATTGGFTPAQRAIIDRVSTYLSSVHVMSGEFAQRNPDGRIAKGQFYLQKPGRVRFAYDPPSPVDIVSDGSSVVVRDRKLATQDIIPLSQTPLRYLLTDRIDLMRDTNVVAVHADDSYVSVAVEEKQVLIGTTRLVMMFGTKDFKLKQWIVTDPQGYDTTVALSNIDSSRAPDPGLFRIDYTEYPR